MNGLELTTSPRLWNSPTRLEWATRWSVFVMRRWAWRNRRRNRSRHRTTLPEVGLKADIQRVGGNVFASRILLISVHRGFPRRRCRRRLLHHPALSIVFHQRRQRRAWRSDALRRRGKRRRRRRRREGDVKLAECRQFEIRRHRHRHRYRHRYRHRHRASISCHKAAHLGGGRQ